MLDSIIGFLVGISKWSSINIPFNIWFYLAYGVAPLLAFTTTPSATGKRRITCLLLAVAITYPSLTLMNFTWVQNSYREFRECQEPFSENITCPKPVGGGRNYIFYPLFGWVFAAVYVGLWEAIWRIWHRRKIKQQQIAIQGRKTGNVMIAVAILLLIVMPLVVYVTMLFSAHMHIGILIILIAVPLIISRTRLTDKRSKRVHGKV
ncbi:hypothetical protein GC177_02120 [bacterium]|nr:hypothetical protein [bacterium]